MRSGAVISSSTISCVKRCVASASTIGFDKGSDPFQDGESERGPQQNRADHRPEEGQGNSCHVLNEHDPGEPADLLQQWQHSVSMPRLVNGWS